MIKDIFLLFYAVLFGALLSAEICDDLFKVPSLATAVAWTAWAWRVGWLVIARAVYFACALTQLSWVRSDAPAPTALLVGSALLLCSPILGLQQLSYGIIPGRSFRPRRDNEKWRASWLVNGLGFTFVVPAVLVWLNGW